MAYTDQQNMAFSAIAYQKGLTEQFEWYKTAGLVPVRLTDLLSEAQIEDVKRRSGIDLHDYPDWKLSAIGDTNDTTGFYACVIETGEKEAAVAFRGSEFTFEGDQMYYDGLEADAGLLNSLETRQQKEVEKFLEENHSLLKGYDNITMTGHSLAGNLEEHATIVCAETDLNDNIEACVSLDGPGFSQAYLARHRASLQKVHAHMRHIRWSPVGILLNDLDHDVVDYQEAAVSPGMEGRLLRHAQGNLVYDEHGNIVPGNSISPVDEGLDFASQVFDAVVLGSLASFLATGSVGVITAVVLVTGLISFCVHAANRIGELAAARRQKKASREADENTRIYIDIERFFELGDECRTIFGQLEDLVGDLDSYMEAPDSTVNIPSNLQKIGLVRKAVSLVDKLDGFLTKNFSKASESRKQVQKSIDTLREVTAWLDSTAFAFRDAEKMALKVMEDWSGSSGVSGGRF